MSEHTIHSSQTKIPVGFFLALQGYIKFILGFSAMEVVAGIAYIGLFFLKPFPKTARVFRRYMFTLTTKSMLFFMSVQVIATGKPPKKPYFMVGNHLGYVDILVLATMTGATFVSKKEVRKWPGIGGVSALYNTIFINRENRADVVRVSRLITENIKQGEGVILFPEGTSSAGQVVLPFNSSLFDFPAKNNFPVHTFTIRYETGHKKLPASHVVAWWGDIDFLPHTRQMLATRRIKAYVEFHEVTHCSSQRKELAELTHQAISKNFKPTETYPISDHRVLQSQEAEISSIM